MKKHLVAVSTAFTALALEAWITPALAAERFEAKTTCPIYAFSDRSKSWKPGGQNLSWGQKIEGSPTGNWIVFQLYPGARGRRAVQNSCVRSLAAGGTPSAPPVSRAVAPPPSYNTPEPPVAQEPPTSSARAASVIDSAEEQWTRRRSWSAGLEVTSWQQSYQLTETSGRTYGLRSNILAIKPNLGYERALGPSFGIGVRLSVVIGTTHVSEIPSAEAGDYEYDGGSMIGGVVEPALRWLPTPGLQLGLVVPISYLIADLPKTTAIDSISNTSSAGFGGLIESRLTARRFGVALRTGFFRSADNLMWSLLGELYL